GELFAGVRAERMVPGESKLRIQRELYGHGGAKAVEFHHPFRRGTWGQHAIAGGIVSDSDHCAGDDVAGADAGTSQQEGERELRGRAHVGDDVHKLVERGTVAERVSFKL